MTRRRRRRAAEIDPSLLDPSSGLFAQPFFLAALSWRVMACRRVLRPLAFALVEVVDGLPDGPAVAVGSPGRHRHDPCHAAHVRRRAPVWPTAPTA